MTSVSTRGKELSFSCTTHLDGIQLLLRSIPLVSELDHSGSTTTNSGLFANPILFEKTGVTSIVTLFTPPSATLFAPLGGTRSRSFPSQLGTRPQKIAELEFGATVIGVLDAGCSTKRSTGWASLGDGLDASLSLEMIVPIGRTLSVDVFLVLPAVLSLYARVSTGRFGSALRTVVSVTVAGADRCGTGRRRIPSSRSTAHPVGTSIREFHSHTVPIMAVTVLETFPRRLLLLVLAHVQHLVQERFLLAARTQHDGLL